MAERDVRAGESGRDTAAGGESAFAEPEPAGREPAEPGSAEPAMVEPGGPDIEVVETGGVQARDDQVVDAGESLQEQVEESREPTRRLFGTFGGVFTPTVLTILGVIMFLRLGWVVGNAGVLGSLAIILLAFGITALTAMAMSSIVTNIRIGAGGAYAIVSQSLGLEIGGALGIPRYLSQALAITMYIFGLRAGWLWVFPEHNALLVDLTAFLALWIIAYVSADLAMRVQYVIMVIICVSLVSVAVAVFQGSMEYPLQQVSWWGTYPGEPEGGLQGTDFWHVFAVFFPAATGIMAGANMSGDLESPRRSIPVGTMAAVGVSLVIYLGLAYWLARSASLEELTTDYYVMVDKAFWGPPVIAGLLGATFSSALASLVGSARILQAMGEHRVVPGGRWLGELTEKGEPRNSMLVTGGIVLASIMLRELNVVAPLITMFFLLTYAMICGVLFIEQSLNLVSFRPRLRIPRWVSLLGMLGSLAAMFILHPLFSLMAIVLTVVAYGFLARRRLRAPFGDVRSGLFASFAEWAAKHVSDLPAATERSWRPKLLVPVEDPLDLRGTFHLIRDLTFPQGAVWLVGLSGAEGEERLRERLPVLTRGLRSEGVYTTWTLVESDRQSEALRAALDVLGGAFFRPNVLFLTPPDPGDRDGETELLDTIRRGGDTRTGILLMSVHPRADMGRRQEINVWIRDQSPRWELSMELGDVDLALLLAYKLAGNWNGRIRLVSAIERSEDMEAAEEFLQDLLELGRIPSARVHLLQGTLDDVLPGAPQADVSIFGLPDPPDLEFVRRMVERTGSTCLFVRDSGEENVLA